jgi:hypothetical protein
LFAFQAFQLPDRALDQGRIAMQIVRIKDRSDIAQ